MSVFASIGSVSSGTLRTEDLIDSFADALRELATASNNADHIALCEEADDVWEVSEGDYRDRPESELRAIEDNADNVLEALQEALKEYAPPYCYFGAHEGDGADFGFWFSSDAFEEACRAGECVKIEDGEDVTAAFAANPDAEYVAAITDHGNVTIYRRKVIAEEIYAIV